MMIFGSTSKTSSTDDIKSASKAAADKGLINQIAVQSDFEAFYTCHAVGQAECESCFINCDGHTGLLLCSNERDYEQDDIAYHSTDYCAVLRGQIDNQEEAAFKLDLSYTAGGGIIPSLAEKLKEPNILKTLYAVNTYAKGEYAFIFMQKSERALYAVNNGRTLYAGLGDGCGVVASDIWTLSSRADRIYAVEQGETAYVTADKVIIYDKKMKKIKRNPRKFRLTNGDGINMYPDTLKKEIFSCPASVESTCMKFIEGNKINLPSLKLHMSTVRRIYLIGSGESYAIAAASKENIEAVTDIPSFAVQSGEFYCSNPVIDKNVLLIAVSQSGENENTVAAVRFAKSIGARTLAVTNTPYSTLSRECKSTLLTSSGYESARINAKFFPAAYTLLCLFSLNTGKKISNVTNLFYGTAVKMFSALPDKIRLALKCEREINVMAKRLSGAQKVILTGQNVDYYTALQGMYTMTATAGADCCAVAATEIKTVLPCVNCNTAIIGLVSCSALLDGTLNALYSAHKHGARTFLILPDSLVEQCKNVDCILPYCDSIPLLNPTVEETVLQLLAYGISSIEHEEAENRTDNKKSAAYR